MAAGFGMLGLSPAAFWSMTPREFSAALRWGRDPAGGLAPRKQDFEALMRRFPD